MGARNNCTRDVISKDNLTTGKRVRKPLKLYDVLERENHEACESDKDHSSDDYSPQRENQNKRKRKPTKSHGRLKNKKRKVEKEPRESKHKDIKNSLVVHSADRISYHKDDFAKARLSLHVSSAPESLPCREDEFATLFSFVAEKIESETGGSMYISGVPGIGKTETVIRVINALKTEHGLPPFKYVGINGMKVADANHAYGQFWEGITGEKLTNKHAIARLDEYFNDTRNTKKEMIVLLIDELDQLVTGRQSLMYQFLNWPTLSNSKLVVLTIANTMDLPERMLTHKNSSRLGLTRLSFLPYTNSQLQAIISSRLEGLNVFKSEAIKLCSYMIGSSTGDARTALDVCRAAAELAESRSKEGDLKLVGIDEIQEIITSTFRTPVIQSIHGSSFHERMFLYAVYYECRMSGIEISRFGNVKRRHKNNCRMQQSHPPTGSILSMVCARLSAARLIITEGFKEGDLMKISLNIDSSDVEKAIKSDKAIKLAV